MGLWLHSNTDSFTIQETHRPYYFKEQKNRNRSIAASCPAVMPFTLPIDSSGILLKTPKGITGRWSCPKIANFIFVSESFCELPNPSIILIRWCLFFFEKNCRLPHEIALRSVIFTFFTHNCAGIYCLPNLMIFFSYNICCTWWYMYQLHVQQKRITDIHPFRHW